MMPLKLNTSLNVLLLSILNCISCYFIEIFTVENYINVLNLLYSLVYWRIFKQCIPIRYFQVSPIIGKKCIYINEHILILNF